MSGKSSGRTCSAPVGAAPTSARSRPSSTTGPVYDSSVEGLSSVQLARSDLGRARSSREAIGILSGRSVPSTVACVGSPIAPGASRRTLLRRVEAEAHLRFVNKSPEKPPNVCNGRNGRPRL